MVALTTLSFGALAAERELDRLSSLFIPTVPFVTLSSNKNKIVLLGNRGAGKTAILAMLANTSRRDGAVVVNLAPEDYAYEILSESVKRENAGAWAKQGGYAAAWKHLIYVIAMKAAVAGKPGLKTGPAKRIYNYLRDQHANMDLNPVGALISYLKRLEAIKLGKLEASLKARELQRLYALEEIAHLLDDLDEVCRQTPLLVLVDELDRGWDASEDAVAFVAGLFQAATSISVKTPHIRLVMSLRRELYESIPALYEDAQKVRDTIETIDWRSEQLFSLICQRIRAGLSADSLTAGQTDQQLWRMVMPAQLWGRPSFSALLDLTLFRPRELINLCTSIQDVARAGGGALPFTEANVSEAVGFYARERFADIVAEYMFQYPGLGSILETFRGCRREWQREELELHCLQISLQELRVTDDAKWCRGDDPESIIEALWKIGFLRALQLNASVRPGLGPTFVGSYEVRTANIRNATAFCIHEMFATYLDCK